MSIAPVIKQTIGMMISFGPYGFNMLPNKYPGIKNAAAKPKAKPSLFGKHLLKASSVTGINILKERI